jgi:Tfp pilus assembly PilM family ATPase
MSKLLAIEWDIREARVAVGRRSGKALVVEQAFSVELTAGDTGQVVADSVVGERLTAALSARRVGRAETLVGVGRAGIELRELNIPSAPDDELPDMVRFQAMRQFTGLGDDWPLDFVKLTKSAEGGISVLAAAMLPAMVSKIQDICNSAELSPQRMILRPFAAATLMRHRDSTGASCQLLVDLLADEADLTVMVDEQVVFIRTVRLATGEIEQANKALVGEIRRTMGAAQNQLEGRGVEGIVVCGSEADHGDLISQIESSLSLPAEIYNPFDAVPLSSELKKHLPVHPGRFAPLLGMLLDEAAGTSHQIDFLNPRRRPEPPDRKRLYTIAAVAAGILVLSLAALWWLQLKIRDDEISDLVENNANLKKTHETLAVKQSNAERIDDWKKSDVNWLDELRRLSERMPPGEDAIVTNMSTVAKSEGGQITITGGATGSEIIDDMFRYLSDDQHDVTSKGTGSTSDESKFPKAFTKVVTIKAAEESKASAAQ